MSGPRVGVTTSNVGKNVWLNVNTCEHLPAEVDLGENGFLFLTLPVRSRQEVARMIDTTLFQ